MSRSDRFAPKDSSSRRARVGDKSVQFEALEPRLLLSADMSGLLESGAAVTMEWNGEQVYVAPGQWLLSLDGISGTKDDQVLAAQALFAYGGQNGSDGDSWLAMDDMEVVRQLGPSGLFLLESADDLQYADVFAMTSGLPGFQYVEPDFTLWVDSTFPDDPMFDDLWGLHNTGQTGGTADADIDAPEAWDIHTGTGSVVVGVIDTGVDYTHPDLVDNMWHNPGEIAGDGIDNDANGFIDDYYGWDFINDDSDPMDGHSHGTHCSGIIAGIGNNALGVVGVAWNVQIMALKFLSDAGRGDTSDAVEALDYAIMMRNRGVNIRLTSNSWGGSEYSESLANAIQRSGDAGMLFIAAAGNDSEDGDMIPHYPASYDLDNMITVAATDHNDDLASFSNWGLTSVDLGAPGVNIVSTVLQSVYGTKNGTSMAAPHVAGVAALAWDMNPTATWQEIRDAIFAGADPIGSLAGITVTGGRLNAYNTLQLMGLVIDSSSPGDGEVVTSLVTDYVINFRDPYDPTTVQATDLTVNGIAADSFALDDADTVTFSFNVSPITAEGQQNMFMADGSVTRLSDGLGINDWPRIFRYDILPLDVVAMTPPSGSAVSLPLTTISFDFNEAYDPASVGLDDLVLSMGEVTGFTLVDADTIEYTIDGLNAEIVWQIHLAGGVLTDAFGNPNLPYIGSLELDFSTVSFPAPLESVQPAGSMVYDQSISGIVSAGGDTDSFTLNVDPGQTITAVLVADSGLQATVELYNPSSVLLGSGSAAAAGDQVVLQTLPAATPGTYTVVVSAVGATTGTYTLRIALNTAVEDEAHDGAANDTLATGQDINASFIALDGGASRGVVEGDLGAGDEDWYSFAAAADDVLTIALASPTNATVQVELYDAAGILLAAGENATPKIDRAIMGFVAMSAGTYYVRVTGEDAYGLVVLRNVAFDIGMVGPQDISATGVVLGSSRGTARTVDPDDFPAGTELMNAFDGVTLTVEGYAGIVTSIESDYASTGTMVFGHGYSNSWNPYFEWLRADFDTPVAEFSIDIIGDDDEDPGIVRAYDADHNLLEEVFNPAQPTGVARTVTITRPTADIAYMLAGGVFYQTIVLDNLRIPGVRGDEYSVLVQAGDTLTITTSTPSDGSGEYVNDLDAAVELYDPLGVLVASDDNSAPDGRNVLLTHVATETGEYVINIFNAAGAGEYVLEVTGYTGVVAPALTVTETDPANGVFIGPPTPTQMTVVFSDSVLMSTVDAADLTIDSMPATGVTVVDGRTIIFDLPTINTGLHTMQIAAGAIESLRSVPIDAYSGQFELDVTAPRVVSSTLAEGDVVAPGNLTVTVGFDEPMNASVIAPNDVWLVGAATGAQSITSVIYNPATQSVTLEYTAVPQDAYTLTLLSGDGSLEDALGNDLDGEPVWPLPSGDGVAGGNFVIRFSADPGTGVISGQIYNDLDDDGLRDTGEFGINGWDVELIDTDTSLVVATTTTAGVDDNGDEVIDPQTEAGRYSFTALLAGNYETRILPASGWSQTSPLSVAHTRLFGVRGAGTAMTIYEYDSSDGSAINSFAAPAPTMTAGLQGLAVGPSSLFYLDAGDMAAQPVLWELDLDTGAVIDSDSVPVAIPALAMGLAWLDGEVYIQNALGEITVFDPATDTVVRTLSIAGNAAGGLAASGDLGVLFACNSASQILTIDPATGAILNTFTLGVGPLFGGLAYCNGELLASNMSIDVGSTVHRIDPATGNVLGTLHLDGVGSTVGGLGGDAVTPPAPIWHEVPLAIGQAVSEVDYAYHTSNAPGDMDGDGDVDADDIDLLFADFGDAGQAGPQSDLDADGDADQDDMDILIHDLVETTVGTGSEYGDFNLDGLIDTTDLTILATYYGTGTLWSEGNANGDGQIDTTDLTILATYYGFVATPAPPAGDTIGGSSDAETAAAAEVPPSPPAEDDPPAAPLSLSAFASASFGAGLDERVEPAGAATPSSPTPTKLAEPAAGELRQPVAIIEESVSLIDTMQPVTYVGRAEADVNLLAAWPTWSQDVEDQPAKSRTTPPVITGGESVRARPLTVRRQLASSGRLSMDVPTPVATDMSPPRGRRSRTGWPRRPVHRYHRANRS